MKADGKFCKFYVVKFLDEYGECYKEEELKSLQARNNRIREWLAGSTYVTTKVGDVTVLTKNSGEESWFYELEE